ncbi:MAG: SurA N-terminal domain-containing protein [Nanobdellota archaeon]
MANLKNMMTIVLVLSVILMVGCSTSELEDDAPAESMTGDVVAVVNGEEIVSEEVSTIQESFLQQGQQVSEEEVLEQVINQKVLEQKVQQENIVVATEEAESVIEQQLVLQNMTLDAYKQQIESQGASYEEELENIKDQMATQSYLETQLEGQSFNVTEDETREFYETYKTQSPDGVPSYEELKPQIVAQLEQQKQQEATSVLIQELRSTADVEYK